MRKPERFKERMRKMLGAVRKAKVAVIGDFGLDAYWFLDEKPGELSAETDLPTRAVRRQRWGLGGAGNVAANLAALGIAGVRAFGVVGDDPFGRELLRMLKDIGVDTGGMIVQRNGWQTQVYGKPFVNETEQPRIDFGRFNKASSRASLQLLERFEAACREVSTIVCNQQAPDALLNEEMVGNIVRLMKGLPGHRFIVDSRHHARLFDSAILKMNFKEARFFLGKTFTSAEEINLPEATRMAEEIATHTKNAVFVTCGERGLVARDGVGMTCVDAVRLEGRVDAVGAGDTAGACIAAALDVGIDLAAAARFANLAAAVTVKKLYETGTATPAEILDLAGRVGDRD